MKKILLPSLLFIVASALFLITNKNTNDNIILVQETNPAFDKSNWEKEVFASISASEYNFSSKYENNFQAVNRNNNLRFEIAPNGFTSINRLNGTNAIEIKVDKITSGAEQVAFHENPIVEYSENTLQYIFPDVTIEYINSNQGLRQNFIIHKELSTEEFIDVLLNLDPTYETSLANNSITLSKDGNIIQQYTDLKAFDATGKNLDAEMLLNGNALTLHVNTANAIYPILIDPLTLTPSWTTEANQAGANMGFAVSAAGDVNNDGFDDVVVGAAAFDAGQMDEGKAFLYLGSASGLSATAIWEDEGDNTGALMGKSVAAAGDVNGDGYDDLLVGLGLYSGGESEEGRAHLYYGNATSVSAEPDWFYEANQAGAGLGFPLEGLGDVNLDGYDDVIIGANGYDNGQSDEGRAYVFYGSASGLAATPDWQVESNVIGAALGHSVSTAGDVNNDGYADAIVGGWNYSGVVAYSGKAWLYYGGPSGLSTTADWEVEGDQMFSYFGFWTSGVGDINNDGFDDIVVGAKRYDEVYSDEGKAWLYYGSASGPSTTADWTGRGDNSGAEYAIQFGPAGDVNNDGFDDMIMGSHFHNSTLTKEGAAYLYLGSATGFGTTPDWSFYGGQAQANMGWSCDGAGDVNNDGYDDVIVGAFKFSNPENSEGRAYVFHGLSTCSTPVGFSVSSVTATTAFANWTSSGDASSYRIVARRTGETLYFISTTTNHTLTGLTPAKKYKSYVQAKCGTTWTSRSNIVAFITPPLRIADPNSIQEVFPNPANQWITINPKLVEGYAVISIFNIEGKQMQSFNYNAQENVNGIYVDIRNLDSGYYFYTIQTEEEIKTGTFIKQ